MSDAGFATAMVYGGDIETGWGADRLQMSDIVIARDTAGGILRRPGVALSPYLGALTSPRFVAYWEVYGAPPGTPLRVSLRILGERRLLSRRRELELTFTEEVPSGGSLQMRKSVEHGLPPGHYTLRLEVHSPALKASARREAVLEIR